MRWNVPPLKRRSVGALLRLRLRLSSSRSSPSTGSSRSRIIRDLLLLLLPQLLLLYWAAPPRRRHPPLAEQPVGRCASREDPRESKLLRQERERGPLGVGAGQGEAYELHVVAARGVCVSDVSRCIDVSQPTSTATRGASLLWPRNMWADPSPSNIRARLFCGYPREQFQVTQVCPQVKWDLLGNRL